LHACLEFGETGSRYAVEQSGHKHTHEIMMSIKQARAVRAKADAFAPTDAAVRKLLAEAARRRIT
jgi:hypothetical protein